MKPVLSARGGWIPMLLVLGACGGADEEGAAGPPTRPSGESVLPEVAGSGAADTWFSEEAEALGLRFVQESGAGGDFLMPEIMGGGAALFDADGDGDLDAYLVQAGSVRGAESERSPNRLFRFGGGAFEDVTEGSGSGDRGYGNGVACGDADGDGSTDLYVTNFGANRLLLNRTAGSGADLRFERSAAAAAEDDGWGTSAVFFDADVDGDLDLFVCNYLAWRPENELVCFNMQGARDYCSPKSYESPASDLFLENQGGGALVDRTREAGLFAVGTGLGVAALDVDGDGLLDVFVANDGMPDRLWWNAAGIGGGLRFEDRAGELGIAVDGDGLAKAGMGVVVADFDADGREDLAVCNLARESDSVYLNRGTHFTDSTRRVGMGAVSKPYTRFGFGAHDFDLDGRTDLYQANGRVQLGDLGAEDPFAEPDLVLRGVEGGRFAPLGTRAGASGRTPRTGRAAAFGDVDGDGDVDVIVVNRDAPAEYLRNHAGDAGAWIGIDGRDANGAPACGATVVVRTTLGTRQAVTRSAYSYQAANDPRVRFALAAGERVLEVSITWLDGAAMSIEEPAPDRYHRLARADAA